MWKEDEKGTKSSVFTYNDQIEDGKTKSGSIGYRIFSDPTAKAGDEITYSTTKRGAILTEDSQYASLAGDFFATIKDGVTTLILTMPANGEIRLVNLPSGTKYEVREIISAEDTTAEPSYAATLSQVKKSSGMTGDTVSTDNTVAGTISGNTASVETYYNWASNFYVYHSSDNTIEKISFADNRVAGTYDKEKGEYVYTFNIVNETKATATEKFLYGGYYKTYAGAVNKTVDQIKELT